METKQQLADKFITYELRFGGLAAHPSRIEPWRRALVREPKAYLVEQVERRVRKFGRI